MTAIVTGQKKLDRKLKELSGRISSKAVASGIRGGLAEMRAAMRQQTPNASAKKTVKSRFKRQKKAGITTAKVGAGVGKRGKGASGSKSGGVGLSQANAHWYFMGTSVRQTRSGANRGRMPKVPAIKRGATISRATVMTAMRKKTWSVIDKEARKMRA